MDLHTIADAAAIVTAISVAVSAWGYIHQRRIMRSRRLRMEEILKGKSQPNDDSLTLHQLAMELTATEAQVIKAASRSKKVEGWAGHVDQQYRLRYIRR